MFLTAVATLVASSAGAARAGGARRSAYATDKEFGLGVMIGAPTGLAGKYFLGSGRTALAFGVGSYDDHYYLDDYHENLHLHLDVLWHPAVLARGNGLSLPLYLGVGGRLLEHGDYYDTRDDRFYDGHTHLGVRVPFGLAFDFHRTPLDLFFELVPVVDLAADDGHRRRVDLTGAIGLRYYF